MQPSDPIQEITSRDILNVVNRRGGPDLGRFAWRRMDYTAERWF